MALLPSWARIEPHAQTTDIDSGLAAEIADPLWMLLRQWQFGELRGDDAGAPVAVDVAASWSTFCRYRAGHDGGEATPFHPETDVLEALVEREPVIRPRGYTPWTAAVRAGRTLQRLLAADPALAGVAQRLASHEDTRFDPPDDVAGGGDATDRVWGVDDGRYRDLLGGRMIDGAKVVERQRSRTLPDAVVGDVDPDALSALLDRWVADMDVEWGLAASDEVADVLAPAWERERQEYAFSIAAPPLPGDADEFVLSATGYDGTGVSWDSLDRDTGAAPLGAVDDPGAATKLVDHSIRTLLATPLTYRGMPADRFWEFEDAAVALGQVRSGATDLARMLAVDFAVVYSPDWYIAPVEVPVGCIARTDWVIVRDTFGVATLVGTTATQSADYAGRQFQPSNLAGAEGDNPYLVVLPSALAALTSEPREEVALQRDEMANLAWSIEKTVMGPSGRPVPRPWFAAEFALPPVTGLDDYELIWRLATNVAHTWTPLVAARDATDHHRVLRKAQLLDTEVTTLRDAKGLLMADTTDIRDEEITRAGVQLRITEQLARTPAGQTVVWRGREKRSWRGEASSGLRFDAATPRTTGEQ